MGTESLSLLLLSTHINSSLLPSADSSYLSLVVELYLVPLCFQKLSVNSGVLGVNGVRRATY